MNAQRFLFSLALVIACATAHAGFDEAKTALEEGNWAGARVEAQQLVKKRDHRGDWILAHLELYRRDGAKPTPATSRALQVSASKGLVDAEYDLGWAYVDGDAVTRNRSMGHAMMLSAAQKGLARAQWGVAHNFIGGLGTTPSPETAVVWVTAAAKQNYAPAYSTLASMHYNSIGLPENKLMAMALVKVALHGNRAGSAGMAEANQVLKWLSDDAKYGLITSADNARADRIASTMIQHGLMAGFAVWREGGSGG